MQELANVALFVYNRFSLLQQTISALQLNYLAPYTELYIFSDGPRDQDDLEVVQNIRNYLKTVTGFKSVIIIQQKVHKGLAASIIYGVTQLLNDHEKIIVLEDDLITSSNFLNFMNDALKFYEKDERIISISGYTQPINNPQSDVYFTKRTSSWGWATWKDRWEKIDWEMKGYHQSINDSSFKKSINSMGSDLHKMLNDYVKGKIDSWAVRWCYHQFLTQQFTVHPTLSKIQNMGMQKDATNTKNGFRRFRTVIDNVGNTKFNFAENPSLDPYYLNQFLKKFSVYTRIKYKILNILRN